MSIKMGYLLQNKASMKNRLKTIRDFTLGRLQEGQKIGMINLGCARNLVDAQGILGKLKKNGHRIVDFKEAQVAIVNTCAFIEEAKRESIDTIIDLLELKKEGKLKKVIVAGCLAQRYGHELAKEFQGIDAIMGAQRLDKEGVADQVYLTPKHFAYVKICESCYNRCSFCAIPAMKGKFVSRTMESIMEEIKRLDSQGVREINIIGQDITAYGMDIYREKSLARLLKEISALTENIQWIRLLYTFPAHVTDELIEVMGSDPKICRYIDMPLQHISDPILKRMNRSITTAQTRELIYKIRKKVPQGSLRTTFIVGLPGEGEEDFEELLGFVKEVQFDKLGVFVYSREEGTPAYDMLNQVPEPIKKKRLNALMRLQKDISKDTQRRFVGKTLKVLIEEKEKGEGNVYVGRSEYDAPDVDGVIFVSSKKKLRPGGFVDVLIRGAYEYDLEGEAL